MITVIRGRKLPFLVVTRRLKALDYKLENGIIKVIVCRGKIMIMALVI